MLRRPFLFCLIAWLPKILRNFHLRRIKRSDPSIFSSLTKFIHSRFGLPWLYILYAINNKTKTSLLFLFTYIIVLLLIIKLLSTQTVFIFHSTKASALSRRAKWFLFIAAVSVRNLWGQDALSEDNTEFSTAAWTEATVEFYVFHHIYSSVMVRAVTTEGDTSPPNN